MNDPAVSKARDILHRLSADPETRRLAEERERAQITRGIEDGALLEEGRKEGREEGRRALSEAVLDLCEAFRLPVDDEQRTRIESMSFEALVALRRHVKLHRAWP